MIYLFTGDDTKSKISAYEKFIGSWPKGTEIFPVSRNGFDRTHIESLYSGSGLFSAKNYVVFSNILEYEGERDFILEKLPLLGESESDFIFLEGKLGKPILDAFKKARAEINVFEQAKEKKERFNNFLLANAFGARDKFNLWLYFRQAMDLGTELEPLVGVLFWKVKDMLLKKSYGKFTEEELTNFAARLSYLLPEARGKGADAEAALEQFILEAF